MSRRRQNGINNVESCVLVLRRPFEPGTKWNRRFGIALRENVAAIWVFRDRVSHHAITLARWERVGNKYDERALLQVLMILTLQHAVYEADFVDLRRWDVGFESWDCFSRCQPPSYHGLGSGMKNSKSLHQNFLFLSWTAKPAVTLLPDISRGVHKRAWKDDIFELGISLP